MPFTGSHPAAVLPFLRSLPPSALVIGSMAPDFPLYLPGPPAWRTHTARGVVGVDLLLGAAGWALWHGLLAEPALAAAPAGLRARLGERTRLGTAGDPAAVARTALGLVVGAATHVLWDEFTHDGRYAVRRIPVLHRRWRGRPGYVWAQDGGGVVGAAALLGSAARWWRRTPATRGPQEPGRPWVWAAVATAGLAGAGWASDWWPDSRSDLEQGAFRGGATATATGVLLALGDRLRRRTDPAR